MLAIVATTIGALFPDIDVLFDNFVPNQMATLELHRGVTHSLVCWPLFALGLAAVTWLLLRWRHKANAESQTKRPGSTFSWPALLAMYAAGLLSHIVLDYVTSWGTMLAAPLSRTRFSWDLVFILDFLLTATVLLPQVAVWVHSKRERGLLRATGAWGFFLLCAFGARSIAAALDVPFSPWTIPIVAVVLAAFFFLPHLVLRNDPAGMNYGKRQLSWCRAGFAALVVYLSFCAAAHHLALERVEQFAAAQGLRVESIGALPMPPWLGRWMGLVRTPRGVHQSVFNLLDDGPPQFQFVAGSAANRYVETARQTREAQIFLWFARFPVVRYFHPATGGHHAVEFNDLRFFQRGSSRPAPFTYRVVLDDAGRVIDKGWVE